MPPKLRLHNKHGKIKSFPSKPAPPPLINPSTSSNDAEPATSNEEIPDSTHQFEVELCWCIQQLEIGLQDKKINTKQAEESIQLLNLFRNKSQPIVRKRQLMRMHFGDYRSVMAKEEKIAKKSAQISFTKSSEKHTFIRKSTFLMGDNNFKFNFQAPNEDNNTTDAMIENNPIPKQECIQSTDNNEVKLSFNNEPFKFNFCIE